MRSNVAGKVVTFSDQEIAALLEDKFGVKAEFCERLGNGFSAANYKVTEEDGTAFVAKFMVGSDLDWVRGQTRIQEYLRRRGYLGGCLAFPLLKQEGKEDGSTDEYVAVVKEIPVCVLGYINGISVDEFLTKCLPQSEASILFMIGTELATLHSVVVTPDAKLRAYNEGGVFAVTEHMNGVYLGQFEDHDIDDDHPFYKFYEEELVNLIDCMNNRKLPKGIIHGDPYLDNIILDEKTGEFRGIIDWEDTTVGPFLFDLGCAVAGTCYSVNSTSVDRNRFQALLQGYVRKRRLTAEEKEFFSRFLQLALFLNCAWRFKHAYIDHPEVKDSKNSHIEIQEKILLLKEPETQEMISKLLEDVDSKGGGVKTMSSCLCSVL